MSAKPATEDTVVGLDQPYVDVNGSGAPVKGGGGGGGSAAAGSSAVSLKATIALGLVIFALLQLIALWVLTFVYHIPVDAVQLSTSSFGGSTDQRALSFAPGTSTLRVGAGTTAYLDAATLPSDTMHYVQLAPTTSAAPSTVAVFSYYLPDKSQTAVTVVRVKSDKSVSIDAVDSANTVTNQIRGLATLSDSTTVALEQTSLGNVFVTPISTVGQTVSVQTSKRVSVATGSISNAIGAVSSSQFVVAYFEQYAASTNYYQRLVGGSVGSDGTITLSSTPLQFGTANFYGNSTSQSTTFGKPTTVSSVANAFLLPWWSSTTTSNPGLCIFQGAVGSNGDVTKKSETCSTKYLPANFVDSTVISSTSILLAFHDSNNNNEFTLLIVEASASKVFFKSSFIVSGAGGSYNFGSFYSWYPRPVVSLVSSTRVAVALFNPSSQGRPYTQVFALTDASSLKPVTPLLPLADSSFTLAGPANSAAASGSVTLAIVPVSSEAFLVSYAGKLSTMASPKRLSLVEFYGPVAGIGKGSKGLIVNGVASVGGGLTSGMSYYTTTKGDVVSVTSTDATADYFVSGTSTVVSADSRLGVAVDDKSIYVTARAA